VNFSRFKNWKKGEKGDSKAGMTQLPPAGTAQGGEAALDRPAPEPLPAFARGELLKLARETLVRVTSSRDLPGAEALPPGLGRPQACFVTLTQAGQLRGCVGHIHPRAPLYQAVMENARSAATRDPRFAPVQPMEVPGLRIEISVLSEVKRLTFDSAENLLDQLQPHVDGVVFQWGAHTATFLPQVWEQIPDKIAFLNRLAQKAGCHASAWRDPGSVISVYQVEAFHEPE